jgi:hypothetical protein
MEKLDAALKQNNSLKLFIPCILLNIHLQNQLNAQVSNTSKSMVLHYSYMFLHVCAIFREFKYQILNLLPRNRLHP